MATQPINTPTAFDPFASRAPVAGSAASKASDLGGSAPNQQMFLQLLVAQIKNQDPSSPSDPSQFVAQLAQFSQLEQTIAIRQGIDTINAAGAAAATETTKA